MKCFREFFFNRQGRRNFVKITRAFVFCDVLESAVLISPVVSCRRVYTICEMNHCETRFGFGHLNSTLWLAITKKERNRWNCFRLNSKEVEFLSISGIVELPMPDKLDSGGTSTYSHRQTCRTLRYTYYVTSL